ncbi:class I SAM-dependent methyltransferase [Ilyomonas limi]|uniref:Class I SAM-dependent methyltransferase n=1 Tax=Ilyomonas limi TaxID=2575867 RepID=A0A4U3L5H4_9BACT|nr:class I SAM-dependent methyltransferase [Ilyomonas limi]TKK70250.1 class I SAM-dependent methyltransferase [Ilyomonas limi]
MSNDVLGAALHDYYFSKKQGKLWIINQYGPKEEMPVAMYFRQYNDMPLPEQAALQYCKGKILDIGAGAGSHALWLQQHGHAVTAIDTSAKAVEVMQHRGITKPLHQDIFDYTGDQFDTLLLLMNGIGLVNTISGLQRFLQHAKQLLLPGGQLLFDSSDVAYIYEGNPLPRQYYYGETAYRYQYKKQKTEWFTWLYIDKKLLKQIAVAEGYAVKFIAEDEYGQYLVRLKLKT